MSTISLADVRHNPDVRSYIESANRFLDRMGYTEHGLRHAGIVANVARMICLKLDYSPRESELAAIAGFMHDMGNVVNRHGHGQSGALMAFRILTEIGMDAEEIALILGAIGNHEEVSGTPVSYASAAVILADKSDVHYSRVRNPDPEAYDIHDRVNSAVRRAQLRCLPKEECINLTLTIDTSVATVMHYFEIFLSRMVMCRNAAELLGCQFRLTINGVRIG